MSQAKKFRPRADRRTAKGRSHAAQPINTRRKRIVRRVFGTAFTVVPDEHAQTHIAPGADLNSRALWSSPAIKYSKSEFDANQWIGQPIRDTHGRHNIGRVIGATLVGHQVKIAASFSNDTEAGARALRAFAAGKRLAFSVSYRSTVDPHTGRVLRKAGPDEVSICETPHFPECQIQVAASDRETNSLKYLTSTKQPALKYVIVMAENTPATTTEQQNAAPAAVPAEQPAPDEQIPNSVMDDGALDTLQKLEENAEAFQKANEERRRLVAENERMAAELAKYEEEKAAQRAKVNEQRLAGIADYKALLAESLGDRFKPENEQALNLLATDDKHHDFLKGQAELTMKACAEVEAAKAKLQQYESNHARLQQVAQRGVVAMQASSVPTLMGLDQRNNNARPARNTNMDSVFDSIFSDSSAARSVLGNSYADSRVLQATVRAPGAEVPPPVAIQTQAAAAPAAEAAQESPAPAVHTQASGQRDARFPYSIRNLPGGDAYMKNMLSMPRNVGVGAKLSVKQLAPLEAL